MGQAAQDPKLKVPDVGSADATAAARSVVKDGENAAMRKEMAAIRLEMRVFAASHTLSLTDLAGKLMALRLRIEALETREAPRMPTRKSNGIESHGETQIRETKIKRETKTPSTTRGRPRKIVGEPWKAEGVSRATFMRRRKSGVKK